MSSITTMVYDTAAPQRPKPSDDFRRAIVGPESVRSVTITHAYDNSGAQTERVGIHGVVTTCTYVDIGYSGLENRSRGTCSNSSGEGSLESRLIAKLLTLLRNPPQTGQPLWWHVWKMVAEDPWLHSQQITIGRRLVPEPQALGDVGTKKQKKKKKRRNHVCKLANKFERDISCVPRFANSNK